MRVSSGMEVTDLWGNTRMYKRPSLRRYCEAATRPASMVWALIHPPWVDCSPKSPNTTRLPRVALPFIRPLWLFRCLTLLGISAIGLVLLIHTLIDPHLDTNVSLGRHGLGKSVIDFGPQRRERDRAGDRLLAPSHFRSP